MIPPSQIHPGDHVKIRFVGGNMMEGIVRADPTRMWIVVNGVPITFALFGWKGWTRPHNLRILEHDPNPRSTT